MKKFSMFHLFWSSRLTGVLIALIIVSVAVIIITPEEDGTVLGNYQMRLPAKERQAFSGK